VDDRIHGKNRKVSNLINMASRIRYPLIVLADSDIAVARDYLQKVTAPLLDPKVGVVTCLYRGVSVSGLWSRMGALFINQWFVPSVSLAYAVGSTRFGFGATLALRATTLARIGGFIRLKDCLADDYWLAEYARLLGLRTVLSSEVVATDVIETTSQMLWSRELRWLRTIRSLNPLGFGFLFITFTSPWVLIAGALSYAFYIDAAIDIPVDAVLGAATDLATNVGIQVANDMTTLASIDMTSVVAGIAASGCFARLLLHGRTAYHTGGFWRDLVLLPVRDSVLLLQWMVACFGARVAWRGASIVIDDSRARSNPVFRLESQFRSRPASGVTPKQRALDKPTPRPSSLAVEPPCTVKPSKRYD
jgi:ceramide glucosyltransferase